MYERSSMGNSVNAPQSAGQMEGNYAGPYPSLQEPGSSLAEMFGAVRRRKRVLFGVVAGSLLFGGIVLAMLTPRYTAEAMILIESQTSNIASITSVVSGLPGDAASVQSEAYILNSRTLAHRIIAKLNLIADPEFNEDISAATVKSLKTSAFRYLSICFSTQAI